MGDGEGWGSWGCPPPWYLYKRVAWGCTAWLGHWWSRGCRQHHPNVALWSCRPPPPAVPGQPRHIRRRPLQKTLNLRPLGRPVQRREEGGLAPLQADPHQKGKGKRVPPPPPPPPPTSTPAQARPSTPGGCSPRRASLKVRAPVPSPRRRSVEASGSGSASSPCCAPTRCTCARTGGRR